MPTAAPPTKSKPRAATDSPDFGQRVRRALDAAHKAGADHFLITSPVDVGYLTGFLGGDSYLLLGPTRPLIVSDFRYKEELHPLRGRFDIHIRKGQMVDALAGMLADHRVTNLALQADHVTLAQKAAIGRRAPDLTIVETTGILAELRSRKDASEIGHIRAAVRIGQDALAATLQVIDKKLGRGGSMSELEIASILESEMKTRGSVKPSFETIIAARAKGSLPHYRPGSVKLTRGQPLLIDWGATWMGYHGDMTRTFCWGRWPKKLADVYRIVHEAHQLAASALRAGRTTFEIDKIARDHISGAGYGDRFGHGLGHGIGLDIHEGPRLTNMAEPAPLETGQVVTIEPGVYLPGVGGVRLENDYLVTDTGATCLCTTPMDFKWATR